MADKAGNLLRQQGFDFDLTAGCAKVTLVGMGMQGVPGVVLAVMEALGGAGIPVLQTVDSEMTISCLVHEADMGGAVRALHESFALS